MSNLLFPVEQVSCSVLITRRVTMWAEQFTIKCKQYTVHRTQPYIRLQHCLVTASSPAASARVYRRCVVPTIRTSTTVIAGCTVLHQPKDDFVNKIKRTLQPLQC